MKNRECNVEAMICSGIPAHQEKISWINAQIGKLKYQISIDNYSLLWFIQSS